MGTSAERDALHAAAEAAAARLHEIAAGTAPLPRGGLVALVPAALRPLLRACLARARHIDARHTQHVAALGPYLDEDGLPTIDRFAPVALEVVQDQIPAALAGAAGRPALLALLHAFRECVSVARLARAHRRTVRRLGYVPLHPPAPDEVDSFDALVEELAVYAEADFFVTPVTVGGGARWPTTTAWRLRAPAHGERRRPRGLRRTDLVFATAARLGETPGAVRRRKAAYRREQVFLSAFWQLIEARGDGCRIHPIVVTRPPFGCRPCRLRRRGGFLYRAGPPLVIAIPPDWRLRHGAVVARIVDEAGVLPLRLGRPVALDACSGAAGDAATLWRGLFLVRRGLALTTTTGCLVEGQAGGQRRFAFGTTVGAACEALAQTPPCAVRPNARPPSP